MNDKIKRLRELREMKSRKAHLEALRSELTKQLEELNERVTFLKNAAYYEQKDVDALQKPGVKSLFYGLIGKKEKKLEKEEKEAFAARLNYESALREQNALEQRSNEIDAELASLGACSEEYEALIKELLLIIQDEKLAQQNEGLHICMKQISDAKTQIAGAIVQIETVNKHLKEAERWASAVQFSSGEAEEQYMFDALDNARRVMGHLQEQIEQLKTKLSALDMELEISYHANVISGMKNRMLSGAAVMQMVKHAYGQNHAISRKLPEIMEQLEYLQRKTERELDDCCETIIKMAWSG